MEQLVFGNPTASEPGRAVLAVSEGLEDQCRDEIVRLCEGWGPVPDGGPRRPIVLAFPLSSRLRALAGELFAVIRISEGLRPIFHAVVITARDYQDFDLNPFALVQENIFLDSFAPGQSLARRAVTPSSLAPLVSPPPGTSDVGAVDEAVRQILANDRLLLPLEQPISDSDRFLALVVASLPRAYRRLMRLATWAPTGTNHYTLGATFKDSAYYSSWQPYLMTTVIGDLDHACNEYLEDVKRCLQAGDLAGLERLSKNARIDPRRSKIVPRRASTPKVGADGPAVSNRKPAKAVATVPAPGANPKGKRPSPIDSRRGHRAVGRAGTPVDHGQRSGARRGRPRRPAPRAGGVRRGFAILLSVAILAAGAWYLWSEGHWTRLPGLAIMGDALESRTDHGVVDVGAIYRAALEGVQAGGLIQGSTDVDDRRRRGLELLRQAGQLLDVQGRDYLDKSDETLSGEGLSGRKPAPPRPLQQRGEVIARELRRLVLARVSLRDEVDWRDLDDLDGRALTARYDSLLARGARPLAGEPDLHAVDLLLRRLDVTTRQVRGLAELQRLLGAPRWQSGWSASIDAAVDAMGAVQQPHAQQVRDDARVLARLKRAEHHSGFAERAYRGHGDDRPLTTPAVADILPDLYRRVGAPGRTAQPLLSATADLHRALAEVQDGSITLDRLEALLPQLARNRAVAFDPAVYGDHVERLRFLQLELQTMIATSDTTLTAEGPPADVRERLRFLRALETGLDAEGWRALAAASTDPFLVRWARHRADVRDAERAAREQALAATAAELAAARASLLRLARAGGRCGEAWCDLARQAARAHTEHATETTRPDLVADLETFADALAAPPVLSLAGVTARLEPDRASGPMDVTVELRVGDAPPRISQPLRIGPSAPAGTGWVGATPVDWQIAVAPSEPVVMVVRRVDDAREIARFEAGGWLDGLDPVDLGRLDDGGGARLTWRLASPYWDGLTLPELGEI
ncbi:hypothetical protein GF314_11635 [bacterium]|nr:hypothetical protein [bacterium]